MPDGFPSINRVTSRSGIRRDGTSLDGDNYSDGEWVRFYRGKPKKMGGYRSISSQFTGPVRGVFVFPKQNFAKIFTGSYTKFEETQVDENGLGASISDRTPALFVAQTDYLWQMDTMYDATGAGTYLIAHPGRNLTNIDNDVDSPVYYGDINAATPLIDSGQSIDGGIVALPPYLVLYGSNGEVRNSNANSVTDFTGGDANTSNPTGSKIVKGLAVRSGGQSPAALLWSLDSVLRMSYVGGDAIFRFDTLSGQSSILSSSGVIEYDGIYYWPGIDRFLMFNGAIRELPNQMNLNYFFDNLNYSQRQKVWAMKMPRWGEIWWFFPYGEAEECNRAVIFNIREETWYDAILERSSGYYSQVFKYPIMAESSPVTPSGTEYRVWQHEFGRDKVDGASVTSIKSSFTTSEGGFPTGGMSQESPVGVNVYSRVLRIEPDFKMSGSMKVEIFGRRRAQSPEQLLASETFDGSTEVVDFRVQDRHIAIKFTSDDYQGDYEMGSTLVSVEPGDIRE